jgi:putative oxidoreductase
MFGIPVAPPFAAHFADLSLLILRLMVALEFWTSGYNHLTKSKERAKSLGLSVPFTIFLGTAELAGSLGVASGILAQWAALGLIFVMLGAIYMKAVKWKTGFWGEGSMGWHYEMLLVVMNLVIMTMGPGRYSW